MASTLLNGIEVYYKLDTDGSILDSVGSNDGTINGATFTTSGKINGAYSFDGINDYLTHPTDAIGSIYSVSFWGKVNALGPSLQFFMSGNSSTPANLNAFDCFVQTDGTLFAGGNDRDSRMSSSTGTIVPGNWYHIVFVANGKDRELYINGVSVDSGTQSDDALWFASRRVGYRGNSIFPLNGFVDEIGVWSRVLTPTEIAQLYNEGNGFQYPFLPTEARTEPFRVKYDPLLCDIREDDTYQGIVSVQAKVIDYDLKYKDRVVLLDATSNTVTATLPINPILGQTFFIKCIDNTFTCDVDPNGKEIDNSSANFVLFKDDSIEIVYDGTQWRII